MKKKIKFKDLRNLVKPENQKGLSEYHKQYGGVNAEKLCRLITKFNSKRN